MLESWTNDVVIALAGLVLGSIVGAMMLLDPRGDEGLPAKRPGDSIVDRLRRQHAEEQEQLANAPRSFTLAATAFSGFIAVVVLSIVFSPLEMRWWWFLGGLAAGVMLFQGIGALARAGKLPVPPDAPLLVAIREAAASRESKAESETAAAP